MSTEDPGPDGSWSDYRSLHFRLYYYKVLPCTKPFSHDWQHCPFTHPNDKARRRSPLQYPYSADMCPAMLQSGKCPKGVNCNMAHNLFEYHLHPDRYKTKMCRDGAHCNRVFCFFAHSADELRAPYSATAADAPAVAKQHPAGSSNSSSSSTATNTPINQPATPSSSPGDACLLDSVAQQFKVALDSRSMGSNNGNGAEMTFGTRKESGSIGLVGPAARRFLETSAVLPTQQALSSTSQIRHGSGGSGLGYLLSSSSSSRLNPMQHPQGTTLSSLSQQQQPAGALFGGACDAAANQQQHLQACYTAWGPTVTGIRDSAAVAAAHGFGGGDSKGLFGVQPLLPSGVVAHGNVTSQQADIITSLPLPAASSAVPWPGQAAHNPGLRLTSSSTVTSGVNFTMPVGTHLCEVVSSLPDSDAGVAMNAAAMSDLPLMYPSNAAAAAAVTTMTGSPQQQQKQHHHHHQQQPLQLFVQPGSTSFPVLAQQSSSMLGQHRAVLLPITLLTAAAGEGAMQHRTVSNVMPHCMPAQQQQAFVLPMAAASSTAPASGVSMQQWLV